MLWRHVYLGGKSKYVHKNFRKTNISYPLIRTHTCAYQGVRNISFSDNFAYVLSGWPFINQNLDTTGFHITEVLTERGVFKQHWECKHCSVPITRLKPSFNKFLGKASRLSYLLQALLSETTIDICSWEYNKYNSNWIKHLENLWKTLEVKFAKCNSVNPVKQTKKRKKS